jgi:hypothetical protein
MGTHYIRIEGEKADLLAITEVSGLDLRPRTGGVTEAGSWQVFAYATDEAIAELEGRGLVVEVRVASADADTHIASLDRFIGEDSGGSMIG